MATNAEVIGDALRETNVIAEGQPLAPEQGLYGLRKLNEMLEEWTERDVDLGYFAQTDTTEDCPIPTWAENAVKLNLAIAQAGKYGVTVSQELRIAARDSFQVLQRKRMVESMPERDMSHLPRHAGFGPVEDITDD